MKGIEKIYYNPNFANFYNLNEGLIQFYSIDKVANHLKSKFTNVIDVVNHAVNIYRLPSKSQLERILEVLKLRLKRYKCSNKYSQ